MARYWDDVKTGVNKNPLDKALGNSEYPEQADLSSQSNDWSSSSKSASDSDKSDVEEIYGSHQQPGTYSSLIERRRDSPANSPTDSSS